MAGAKWPATSLRPTNPPTGRAPALSSTRRLRRRQAHRQGRLCDRARHPHRLDGRQGRAQEGRRQGRQGPGQGPAAGEDQAARAAALALDDLLRRRELRRSRRRDGGQGRQPAAARSPYARASRPGTFIKASRSVADPGATVKISNYSKKVDWEVELAAVIGQPAKDVPQSKALSYVAGYTVANDLSARDRGRRPASLTPRRSRPTGPSTRASTAPARSAPGSCRRATSATRRTSASSCGSTTSSSRIPTQAR